MNATEVAIVSHYLHNAGDTFAKTYEEGARGLISGLVSPSGRAEDVACVGESQAQYSLFPELFSVPFPPTERPRFTFIDLFAGIGGFRIAMQRLGGKCVFSSEWDAQAQKTYLLNYGSAFA